MMNGLSFSMPVHLKLKQQNFMDNFINQNFANDILQNSAILLSPVHKSGQINLLHNADLVRNFVIAGGGLEKVKQLLEQNRIIKH
jgi:hypothetical protein